MLDVRYGNRRIELKPGKPTIEVGAADNLLPTLQAVKDAIAAGELDKLLMAAKKERWIEDLRKAGLPEKRPPRP